MDYCEREKLKDQASTMYDNATTDEERARATLMLIEGHYWRSVEAYGNTHPNFSTYVAHWLEAQKDRVGDDKDALKLTQNVFAILRKQYPPPRNPRIPPGMSYWQSPRSMKRKLLGLQ